MTKARWLLPLCLALLWAPAPSVADGRAVALEVDRRMYIGISGFTAQSRIRTEGGVGSGVNTLSDGLMLRFGRTGRPARYDVEIAQTNYDEARLRLGMASLDYLIPGGDLFSGFAGLVVGYASADWNGNDPLDGGDNFGVRNESDSGPVVGARAGGLIEVTDLVQVEIGYRYLHTEISSRFRGEEKSGKVRIRNIRMVHAGVNFRF